MSAPRSPKFAPNYGWITNDTHAFRPRDTTPEIRAMIVETLLKNDKAFEHVLRQAKNGWYIAATLGKDTLYLRIYDMAQVNDPTTPVVSTSLNMERTAFVQVTMADKTPEYRTVDPEVVCRMLRTAPISYATRTLKPSEVHMCDTLARTLSKNWEPSAPADVPPLTVMPTDKPDWADDEHHEETEPYGVGL